MTKKERDLKKLCSNKHNMKHNKLNEISEKQEAELKKSESKNKKDE